MTTYLDVRNEIVRWANLGVTDEHSKQDFYYREVRPLPLSWTPPVRTDCSFYCILVYFMAGGRDPSGDGFTGWGNSVSLWQNNVHIPQSELMPGDLITFGYQGDIHAVICVQTGPDPICASMGQPGDPNLVPLSVLEGLGQATFLRCDTRSRTPYVAPKPVQPPTTAQLSKAGIVHLLNPTEAHLALRDGYTLYTWNGRFVPVTTALAPGTKEYASVYYATKRG